MVVRVAGKAMVVRALQCAKACGMMVAREAGSVTSRSEVLCANATALMVLRVAGSVSFVSEVQHACEENVRRMTHMAGQRYLGPSPQRQIEVGERGSVEDNLALKAGAALPSTWQHAKAKSPIAVRVAGKLSSCRAVQPSKAEMPT